ncbi:glycosyltransferase family 4 protein [Pseudomonadota bacterium]
MFKRLLKRKPKRLNVLFYYRFLGLGGVEASIINRIEALRKTNLTCEYWFSEYYGTGATYLTSQDYIRKVDLQTADLNSDLESFDVVIVIDYPPLIRALENLDFRGSIVFETHASYPPALTHYYSVLGSEIIRAILVPSEHNRQLVLASGQTSLDPIIIPNCVKLGRRSNRGLRRVDFETKVPAGPIVLWVGRMEDQKNPTEAIQIFQTLHASQPQSTLLMVGDTTNYEDYMAALIDSVDPILLRSIVFKRQAKFEEMKGYYKQTGESGGVLLSTSKFESAPMTFIEAMANFCPIVSSDVGGTSELLQQGRLGVLYELGDIGEAVESIKKLTNPVNRNVRSAMLKRAYHYVGSKHGPAAAAERFSRAINDLVESL